MDQIKLSSIINYQIIIYDNIKDYDLLKDLLADQSIKSNNYHKILANNKSKSFFLNVLLFKLNLYKNLNIWNILYLIIDFLIGYLFFIYMLSLYPIKLNLNVFLSIKLIIIKLIHFILNQPAGLKLNYTLNTTISSFLLDKFLPFCSSIFLYFNQQIIFIMLLTLLCLSSSLCLAFMIDLLRFILFFLFKPIYFMFNLLYQWFISNLLCFFRLFNGMKKISYINVLIVI